MGGRQLDALKNARERLRRGRFPALDSIAEAGDEVGVVSTRGDASWRCNPPWLAVPGQFLSTSRRTLAASSATHHPRATVPKLCHGPAFPAVLSFPAYRGISNLRVF